MNDDQYHIVSTGKGVLLSNLDPQSLSSYATCTKNSEVCYDASGLPLYRHGRIILPEGIVYYRSDQNLKSTRLFKEKLSILCEFLRHIDDKYRNEESEVVARMKRLMHNIVTYNAHMFQDVYAFISEDDLSTATKTQNGVLESRVAEDIRGAARVIQLLLRNNMLLKKELSIFERIYQPDHRLDIRSHEIHRAVHSITHTFFRAFNEKGVYIRSQECTDTVDLDYDLFCVGLVHLLENATKYVLPDSEINVLFKIIGTEYWVVFDMISLALGDEEVEKVKLEGYSGELSRKLALSGKGIGLWLLNEVMERMGGSLIIRRDVSPARRVTRMGIPYENNQFILSFKSLTTRS